MSHNDDILENFVFPNVKYYKDVVNPTTFISSETLKKTIEDYFNRTEGSEGSDCRERSSLNGTNTNDISNWDTSEITDMSNLFSNIKQISIEPIILNWDTSNVTNMSWMFYNCKQDFILNFNTSNVTNMSNMFYNAINFNQPLNFDTSNVTNMSSMFNCAIKFNQPLNFNTINVTNMASMFSNAIKFNQPLNFNTSNVTDMCYMFQYATNFNQPLNFDTSNVTDMSSILYMYNIAFANFNQPIYFRSYIKKKYLFDKHKNIYVLTPQHYNKLLLFCVLNQINPELLYLF